MPPSDETTTETKPAAEAGPLWLVVSSAAGISRRVLAPAFAVTLGRSSQCDVAVDDESVSRQHAVLRAEGNVLTVEDLGSRNGTTVMGRKLTRGERVPVLAGAVVELGSVTLVLQRAPATAPVRPVRPARDDAPVVLDPRMLRLYALLDVIAPSPFHVLLLGETGTGKEVFAEEIHARSLRTDKPFLKVNCATLGGSLLESELFGHEKGAFTGATAPKAGIFEAANEGTLFLDEVGELPLETQAKLLRVIENGEVLRLGSVKTMRVDVRFIAATHRDLREDVAAGRFRSDLFFRLNGFSVTIPPLRSRSADVVPLAARFVERAARRLGRPAPSLSPAAAEALTAYDWPGNVRELRTVMERAVVLAGESRTIDEEHIALADGLLPEPAGADPALADGERREERARIVDALRRAAGNQTRAAKLLGVSRRTLINRLEEFGLARPKKNQ